MKGGLCLPFVFLAHNQQSFTMKSGILSLHPFTVILLAVSVLAITSRCSTSARQEPGLQSETSSKTWEQLMGASVLARKAEQTEEALRLCREAMEIAKAFAPPDTRYAQSYVALAEIYRWMGEHDLAEQAYKDAVEIGRKIVTADDPAMINLLESLANFYYYTRIRYDKVAVLYERILMITEKAFAGNNREIAIRASNLATVYQLLGQHDKAAHLHDKALLLSETSSTPDQAEVVQYLLTSADFYCGWGKCAKAESLAQRALALTEAKLKETGDVDAQLDIAVSLDMTGKIYLTCGMYRKAEQAYSRSVAIIEKISGHESADLAPRLTGIASALRGLKQYDASESYYRRALAITKKTLGADLPETATILEGYGALLLEMNREQEGNMMLNKAGEIRVRVMASQCR